MVVNRLFTGLPTAGPPIKRNARRPLIRPTNLIAVAQFTVDWVSDAKFVAYLAILDDVYDDRIVVEHRLRHKGRKPRISIAPLTSLGTHHAP